MAYNQRTISYEHAFVNGPVSSGTATLKNALTLTGLKPNTRYWLWARGGVKHASTDDVVMVYLRNESNVDSADRIMQDSIARREHQNASHYHNYAFSKLITTGSRITNYTNKTTEIQFWIATTNTDVSDIYMTAIDLSELTEDVDYFYEESSTETDLGAAFQTFASKTLDLQSTLQQDGTWLVAGCSSIQVNNMAAQRLYTQMSVDHGTTTTTPEIVNGPEDTNETISGVIGRIFTFARSTATTATVSMKCRAHRKATTNKPDHEFTSVFGLKLSAFDYVYTDYDDTHSQTTATGYTDTPASIVVDSDTTDYEALVFGMSMFEPEATGRSVRWLINVAPSDDGSDQDVFESTQTWDRSHIGQAILPFFMIKPVTIDKDGGDHTIDLRFKKDSSAEYGVRDSGIASIRPRVSSEAYVWNGSAGDNNAETAANWTPTGTPGPRDRAVFNSGSVNCTAGTLELNSIHVAKGYSGTLGSGFTAGFKRMNISSPTATVKMSTKSVPFYVAGQSGTPVIYFTSGSMETNSTKLTATSSCDCVSNGTESTIILDGNFWRRVVVSGRRGYSVVANGSVSKLTCMGTQRITLNSTVANAFVYGPARITMESGSKINNAYIGSNGAEVKWKSDVSNGNVYLYEGRFDLTEASTAYSSDGMYVYDRAILDTRTGFNGFNQPTVFQWWGGRNARWFIDEGQAVTPS